MNYKKNNINSNIDRVFLFLQGPHGSFFYELNKKLRNMGYSTCSICINGGDAIDKFFSFNTFYFTQPRENWSTYLKKIINSQHVTDIFLYGDKRFYHSTAITISKILNIKVWVYEEGYLRPGYITLEEGGVNSSSIIPKIYNNSIADYLSLNNYKFEINNQSMQVDLTNDIAVSNPMSTRVKTSIVNYLGLWFLYPFFPFYKWHRDKGFISEIFGWGIKKLKEFFSSNNNKQVNSLISQNNLQYFAFPLQLSSDAQIKCASSFRDVSDSIECVLLSFAAHANKEHFLIIKLHPLDNSFFNYKKFVKNLAKVLKISDRVFFITDINSTEFVTKSLGMIVINSTMGIVSIQNNKPTINLGNSIYANYGLAISAVTNGIFNHNILDDFWTKPISPIAKNVELFFKILRKNAILPGNFYTDAGIKQTIAGTLERINIGGIRHCIILSKGIRKINNLDAFLYQISEPCVVGWGHKKTAIRAMNYAQKNNLPYYALEDGFIKSLSSTFCEHNNLALSLVLDKKGIYYDATKPSDIEDYLVNYNTWYTMDIKTKATALIKVIIDNNIVKYNTTSSYKLKSSHLMENLDKRTYNNLINSNVDQRVLLIDQTFGDSSITLGNANKNDFFKMLDDAISTYKAEHVFVKIHPNVALGNKKGYFNLKMLVDKNVNIIANDTNSMELLKYFKNVYTVTSGTGFEALMCGCNVTCYGEPFYSNYGLTIDKKNTTKQRRRDILENELTIEILVAAIFYKYSIFVDSTTNEQTTPEKIISNIINTKLKISSSMSNHKDCKKEGTESLYLN